MTESTLEVKIDTIEVEAQVRKSIGAKGLAELMSSIKQVGLLQPILVRENKPGSGKKYTLVAGERRMAACREIGMARIRAMIVPTEQAEKIQLIENIQRENLSLADTARGVALLCGEASQKDIAEALGKSTSWVSKMVSIHHHLGSVAERLMREGVTKDIELLQLLSKIEEFEGSAVALDELEAEIRLGKAGRKEAQALYDAIKANTQGLAASTMQEIDTDTSIFIDQIELIAADMIAEAMAKAPNMVDTLRKYCALLEVRVDEFTSGEA